MPRTRFLIVCGSELQSIRPFSFFSIGDASFATHPGETVPAMGKATKAMMKGKGPKVVIGLGQDALSLCAGAEFHGELRDFLQLREGFLDFRSERG